MNLHRINRIHSPIIHFARFNSSLNNKSIYVIALPITTKKSYIHCHHKPSILAPNNRNKFPLLTKIENKATTLALKGWTKLTNSKFTVNIKVTEFARRILNSIHYEEACLRSFPSRDSMIREINEDHLAETSALIQKQIDDMKIPLNQVKPIPLYHPKFMNGSTILDQLYRFKDESYSDHLKYAILCGIAIPVSLPFALVPVIPNIPGFYFGYRFYCNIKALLGIKHLEYLLEGFNNDDPVIGSDHLKFVAVDTIDNIYLKHNTKPYDDIQEDESLVISKDIIKDLVEELDIPELNDELMKALNQETERLTRNVKVDDPVE